MKIGISDDEFRETYLERDAFLVRGALPRDHFSVKNLDDVLYCVEPRSPFIRVHDGANVIDESIYLDPYNDIGLNRQRLNREKLYALIRNGSTVILHRVDLKSPALKELSRDVSEIVRSKTLANGYISLRPQPSFGNHWDTHDVVAVQLIGRKRWTVYGPTIENPLPGQTSREHKNECPKVPKMDVILGPGDILYVPRGWWHCATSVDELSFHVAIGVHPPRIHDYMKWIVNSILPDFPEFRRTLSIENFSKVDIEDALRRLVLIGANEITYRKFCASIINAERVDAPFDLAAHLGMNTGISDETAIQATHFRTGGDQKELSSDGEVVQVDSFQKSALRELRTRKSSCAGALLQNSESTDEARQLIDELYLQGLVHKRLLSGGQRNT